MSKARIRTQMFISHLSSLVKNVFVLIFFYFRLCVYNNSYFLFSEQKNNGPPIDIKEKPRPELIKHDSHISDIRLPASIIPYHYEVRLQPFIHGDLSIEGSVKILFDVAHPTDNITVHIADIVTHNDTVKVRIFSFNCIDLLIISLFRILKGNSRYCSN